MGDEIREVHLSEDNIQVFYGKDVHLFYMLMKNGELPDTCDRLLEEARKGYFEAVTTKRNAQSVRKLLKFLNLHTRIDVVGD